MLGMSKANGADTGRAIRSGFRPRHWAQAQAENPLARFVPFSSLVSPHDVITRGGDYLRVWRLDGVAFECADEHQIGGAARGALQPAAQPGRRAMGRVDAPAAPRRSRQPGTRAARLRAGPVAGLPGQARRAADDEQRALPDAGLPAQRLPREPCPAIDAADARRDRGSRPKPCA